MDLDLQALLLTHFDSATPQGLATVIHSFTEPGQWRLQANEGERVRATAALSVTEPSAADHAVVDIDLGQWVERRQAKPLGMGAVAEPLRGVVGGAIQFGSLRPRALRGRVPYSVRLGHYGRGQEAWTSLALHAGDVFAVVPMHPGVYALRDVGNGRDGRVQVRYPDPRQPDAPSAPQRPADPFAAITALDCGQGLVLTAVQGSRFVLDLIEADDGPHDLREWQAAHDRQLLAQQFGR